GSSHLYGRGDGAVVVGGGDDNAAGAGKGGSQIIWRSMPVLEEGDGPGREDEKYAEDNILNKAALGAENSGRAHRRIRTNTPLTFFGGKAGGVLGRFLRGKN